MMRRTIFVLCGVLLWASAVSAQVKIVPPRWTLPAGESLVYEGTTNDAFETTVAVTDPTADRTITLPNATGTVALTAAPVFTTSIEISAAAPLFTFTDTTAGEDDFSFDGDADVFSFKSGATTLFQGFGATHASAGDVYFINDVALDSDAGCLYFGASQDNIIGRADASSLYVSKGLRIGSTGAVADNNLAVDGTLSFGASIGPKLILYGAATYYSGLGIDVAAGNSTDFFAHGVAGAGFITFGQLGTDGTTYTEWARITAAGDFGVNTTIPRYQFTTVGVLSSLLSDDGTNYEGLTITPASGSVTFAAVTAGTGADNIDLVLTPAGTGRLKYGIALNTAVDGGLTGAFLANAVGSTGGPTAAAQNGWMIWKDSSGATVWVPVWK